MPIKRWLKSRMVSSGQRDGFVLGLFVSGVVRCDEKVDRSAWGDLDSQLAIGDVLDPFVELSIAWIFQRDNQHVSVEFDGHGPVGPHDKGGKLLQDIRCDIERIQVRRVWAELKRK